MPLISAKWVRIESSIGDEIIYRRLILGLGALMSHLLETVVIINGDPKPGYCIEIQKNL